jgi:hypothetical protein
VAGIKPLPRDFTDAEGLLCCPLCTETKKFARLTFLKTPAEQALGIVNEVEVSLNKPFSEEYYLTRYCCCGRRRWIIVFR